MSFLRHIQNLFNIYFFSIVLVILYGCVVERYSPLESDMAGNTRLNMTTIYQLEAEVQNNEVTYYLDGNKMKKNEIITYFSTPNRKKQRIRIISPNYTEKIYNEYNSMLAQLASFGHFVQIIDDAQQFPHGYFIRKSKDVDLFKSVSSSLDNNIKITSSSNEQQSKPDSAPAAVTP